MANTSSFKSITLAPGECFVLPKDAVVTSIVTSGAIVVTSDCGAALPTPTSYKCGVFYFFIDETENDDTAMEEEIVTYSKITVGGNTYIINELAEPATEATLNLHITDLALIEIKAIVKNVLSDRQRIGVYFQVPEDLFDSTVLQISDRGTLYNLPPNEATCGEYPEPA